MVYGADRIVQMPVMQLYDTGLMQQAINNARYMYEKAEKRMDDFYEKYGEFMSPFQKDMDRYQQIVGGVRKGIDALYASGEDPLRTASGRAKMAQLIRSVDPAEISRMKANAKMGYAYLDDIEKARAKNEFNQDYENFLLNQPGGPGRFQDFSSANGAMWTRSAAGRYSDLNQYTSHIFDALKDSYITTDSNHYDWYGVTENDLAKSLTPDTLGGLLNNDLGRFHYENARRDLALQGNLNPSKQEIMNQFRLNVIAANHEKVHMDRRLNDLWKMNQENAARRAAAASRSPQQSMSDQWSFAEMVRRNSATSIMGQQVQEYSDKTLAGIRDAQINFGLQVSKNTGGYSFKQAGKNAFRSQYGQNQYRASDIATFLGFKITDEGTSTMQLPKSQFSRLHSLDDVISHTTGFRGATTSTDNNWLKDADAVTITPTQGSYGAYMKDARFKNNFEMDVKAYKRVPMKDDNGQNITDDKGNVQYTYKLVGTKRQYIDSNITSMQNDPRSGYLGTLGKDGKIRPTSGFSVTNTQDSRYQDAIIGDKIATQEIIEKTIYQPDAILSELPGYAVTQ